MTSNLGGRVEPARPERVRRRAASTDSIRYVVPRRGGRLSLLWATWPSLKLTTAGVSCLPPSQTDVARLRAVALR
jgi:hypothetical protein